MSPTHSVPFTTRSSKHSFASEQSKKKSFLLYAALDSFGGGNQDRVFAFLVLKLLTFCETLLSLEATCKGGTALMSSLFRSLLLNDDGQDIAEYAVMVAVILIIVVGTIRLIGARAMTVFSNAASSVQ
jgi:Flp pilus assembly pilin Flp